MDNDEFAKEQDYFRAREGLMREEGPKIGDTIYVIKSCDTTKHWQSGKNYFKIALFSEMFQKKEFDKGPRWVLISGRTSAKRMTAFWDKNVLEGDELVVIRRTAKSCVLGMKSRPSGLDKIDKSSGLDNKSMMEVAQ